YLFNTVQAGLELLTEVDSPNIKLHLDTFHLNIEEEDIGVAIQAAGPQLRYFHAAENNRRRPGVGHIPWDTVAGALREISYEGWIVMEAFVRHEGEVGRTLSIWNPLVDDLETEASEGAAFLRQKMGKKESVA
ncbi:MAG: TIM barrel protein, partial [Anaerolineales bacterium]|nr:TIM barrel protein [Anaerolineales bacterium]